MTIRGLAVYLFTTCGLWACTQAPPEVTADESALSAQQAPALASPAIEQPTPEMLRAALSGDPDAMRDAIVNVGTCHTATTCPGFDSCSSWSSLSQCGDTCTQQCCHDRLCNEPDIGGTVYSEQFRVCFNSLGASCTEWAISSRFVCGC